VSLAIVPVYVAFLGIEGYGLIGVYLTLYGVMALLDLGLGTTLNRELARLSMQPDSTTEMRELLRTLEILYWSIGILAGLAIALLGPVLAPLWITTDQLPPNTPASALQLMGFAIACQWPLALYQAGLLGLQRQVLLNVISAAATTVRSLGAVLVLWQVAATVEAFLAWQIFASLAETLVTGAAIWRAMPSGAFAKFRLDLALRLWRFAAGVSAITALSVILTQLDKIILSGVLSLTAFGYYVLAGRLAGGLFYLVGPVIAAFFPRFSQLTAANNENELRRVYHQACQVLSVLVFPPALMLILFPYEILRLWTQSPVIAGNTWLVLCLLAAGTVLNALASPPHVLQLASGWTRLSLANAFITTVLCAPLIYLLAVRYGGVGAAVVWVIVNVGNVCVNAVFTHRRLLRGELWPWLRVDVGPALLGAAAVVGLARWLLPEMPWNWTGALVLGLVLALALVATAAATPDIRQFVARFLAGRFLPAR
jgi:O-antigen/teichoic acid export membrane protein